MTILTLGSTSGLGVRRSPLGSELWADLGWSLQHRGWLTGLLLNLVLALGYLVIDPITAVATQDWAIVVGSYFVVFVLADLSTTNALGLDAERVRRKLADGVPLARILLVKNLTLLLVVGLPTLLATAALTLWSEDSSRLTSTLPGVLLPIMIWLGVGNLISVLLPVRAASLRDRWAGRRDRVGSLRWLAALALPYALCVVVDPLTDLTQSIMTALTTVPAGGTELPVTLLLAVSLAGWGALTRAAVVVARHRGVRLG